MAMSKLILSLSHWTASAITAHNHVKMFLLKDYTAIHNLIYFVFPKHTLTLAQPLMMVIWKL